MIHLMLGATYEVAIRNLMGYVLNYEDKDMSELFTGMLCTREENGNLVFKTTNRVAPSSGNSIKFNSEPDDPFKVELKEDMVITEQNQFDHLKSYFSRLFDKKVTINSNTAHPILNICIYLPMYDTKKWELAQLMIKAISAQNRNINVDLFFFSADLAYLFASKNEQAELPTKLMTYEKVGKGILKEAVKFKENSSESSRLGHIVVMQNCNASGVSLDLDWDSFVRIIGEFAIATMNRYYNIFNPNAEIQSRPIHTFGLCVLSLDKYYYVRYLLSRAYITILEREGVDKQLIDVNGPSQIVQKSLTGEGERYKFYEKFYEHRVKGYLAEGRNEDEINAKAMKDIDSDIEKFTQKVTSFLEDKTLSLPEKRVTLAQLLGMDDEMITGDMFNPDQLLFRDSYADCIDMFVRANNALLQTSPSKLYIDIPEGDNTERADYPECFKSYAVLSDEQIDFKQMTKDLKDDEVKIRRQTEYIRTLEKDYADCNIQTLQSQEKEKVLTAEGFKYGNVTYKVLPIETIPLEKTYSPKGINIPKSVDLRRNFTQIKNQGPIGSCSSFTFSSIIEYILSSADKLDSALSERYLYYNARVERQKRLGIFGEPITESGTSFIDSIKALQAEGICKATLCPYVNNEDINIKPDEEAYLDGRTRLVSEALNVNLKENDIKSALTEGYPVAVSVRLFDSFSDCKFGFVSLPSDEEVAQADHEDIDRNHAMVICGFSDENKVFVVRNSWGTGFGDKGYCYIPYSYITDPHLTNQACIITGTNFSSVGEIKKNRKSNDVVPFDKLNPEINAAIIRVLIGEARREKAALIKHRTDIYTAYTILEKRLVNSEVRSTITEGTKQRLNWEIQEIKRQKNENDATEDRRIEALDKQNKRISLIFFASIIALIIVGIILNRSALFSLIVSVIPITKIFIALLIIGVITMGIWWIVYGKQRKAIHLEHSELRELLEKMEDCRINGGANNSGILGLYKKSMGIRFFIPWLVARKLSEKNRQFEQKYQVMVNYTNNLREWYEIEKGKKGTLTPETRDPFISLLSNETLDKYYNNNSSKITGAISLASLFNESYSIDDSAIVKFQNELKNKIISLLEESLSEFSVYKYLTGKTNFEFAKERTFDTHEMLNTLERKSEVFIRVGASPATDESINSTTTVLMSSDIAENENEWKNQFEKDFSVAVSHIKISSPFKLAFMQMKRLPLEECIDLS